MELTGEGLEEMKKRKVVFSSDLGKVSFCFCFFFGGGRGLVCWWFFLSSLELGLETRPKSFLPRGK